MSDLIKRQDVIRAIEFGISYIVSFDGNGQRTNYFESENAELAKAIERVKEIPSAPQWIKCKDKLPKKFDKYLVVIGQPWLSPRFRWVDVAFYLDDGTWHTTQEGVQVYAWMEIPVYMEKRKDVIKDG